MRTSDSRNKRSGQSLAQASRNRIYAHMLILILLTSGVFAGTALYIHHWKQAGVQSPGPPAKESVAATEIKAGFDRLQGRWLRPDGGYVLEIKSIDASGKVTAAYFNPRPINVSQAEAVLDRTTVKFFIELRDVNYPGATYHLTYDSEKDQLRGVYFQPALQQSFEVAFVRLK